MKLLRNVTLAGLILGSVGSLGGLFNFCNPSWKEVGLNRADLESGISSFPTKNCPDVAREACQAVAKTTLTFLGLNGTCH